MASSFPHAMQSAGILNPARESTKVRYSEIYNQHSHRIYSLAFWMTDNELLADELASNTFLRAFSGPKAPEAEQIDAAFLAEVRDYTTIGTLTLNAVAEPETRTIRGNVKRVHLERAVVQLPPTERLIFLLHDVESYEHERIGRLLGLSAEECQLGLHQARVSIRQSLAKM
jgi:DNA-directed RNA polymerase specialized sigma24 family protein